LIYGSFTILLSSRTLLGERFASALFADTTWLKSRPYQCDSLYPNRIS
jgi:hypothetical protein